MKRSAIVCAVIFGFALLVSDGDALAQEKKTRSIKEIMKIAHGDKSGITFVLPTDIKGEKWDDVTKKTKELVEMSAEIAAATPRRGDADSWKKLTANYVDTLKQLDDAAGKKKADDAKTALETLNASCKMCHMAHKGKGK